MNVLAIDVGTSSVKAALLRDGSLKGTNARAEFVTRYDAGRAEANPADVLTAIEKALRQLKSRNVDVIAPTCMAASWLAMDRNGQPLTPIITHQDRRSLLEARQIEKTVGKARHLRLAGNRPFPGGISSTTAAWFLTHARGIMRRARLVGHLNTFLLHHWTGARVTDPSNAAFMGLYETCTMAGWSAELCDVIDMNAALLPEIKPADAVAGRLSREAAESLGLSAGTPILVGCMDTSAALLAVGAKPGVLLNSLGSTDVLAVCTDRAHPHECLLTRPLGVGRTWVSVSTLAAGGSSLAWAHKRLFAELTERQFFAKLRKLPPAGDVQFAPYLSGERTSVEQRQAAFTGLSLSTTREQMLAAVVDALAKASAARLPLLAKATPLAKTVILTGGVASATFHRDWPKSYRFQRREGLTLLGLATLAEALERQS